MAVSSGTVTRGENKGVRNRCFPLPPDKSKTKTNTAQQAVQADPNKRRVFGVRMFSASWIVCCSSRRLFGPLNRVVNAVGLRTAL